MINLYGIPNCDTVRKARKWLSEQGVEHQFQNFRQHALSESLVQSWLEQYGPSICINKKSQSYRSLTDAEKQQIEQGTAVTLIVEQPTLIKRPVLCFEERCVFGFSESQYKQHLGLS